MKKTLIALAALAAGSAFAQSSVTMYGLLDVGYNGATGVKPNMSNFHGPSRFGIKGTEDLGGGMKANFNLESGNLLMDTGTVKSDGTSGFNFSREAWVGVSGNFGETRLGLTSSFGTKATAAFDLNEISSSSAMDNAGFSPVTWYGSSRRGNQFQYISNTYAGFSGGVAYDLAADATALKGAAGAAITTTKSAAQGMVSYANGPIAAAFVAEGKRQDGVADNRTAYNLSGSYNLGVAKVSAGLTQSPYKAVGYTAAGVAVGGKGANIGVIAPFGVTNVGAQFAHNSTSGDNALELFANYSLSKRTRLYIDTVHLDYKDSAKKDLNRYGVGIVHTF